MSAISDFQNGYDSWESIIRENRSIVQPTIGYTMSNQTDLFSDKSQEWDGNPVIQQLSANVSQAIIESVALSEELTVMDFGAGTGLIAAAVAPRVQKVIAVDVSESMLEQLSAKAYLRGRVEPICQDITEAPLNRQVDGIVSAMALHHVEDTQKCLQTFADHLSVGGFLALADLDSEDGTFHPEGIEGVFHHGFDREQLKSMMEKSGFANVAFSTAHTVQRAPDAPTYPIFLMTAVKG